MSCAAAEPVYMHIRKAHTEDIPAMQLLMYTTITIINSADYSPAQVAIWASRAIQTAGLLQRLQEQYVIVTEANNTITGIASLSSNGYIDLFYVHKDVQRKGVASLMLQHLLQVARSLRLQRVQTDASITALPFFEKQGFERLKQQYVRIQGVTMINHKMQLLLA